MKLCQGKANNSDPYSIGRWIEKIQEIRPLEVQIYTVDRALAPAGIDKVEKKRLDEIALEAGRKTGIPIRVY